MCKCLVMLFICWPLVWCTRYDSMISWCYKWGNTLHLVSSLALVAVSMTMSWSHIANNMSGDTHTHKLSDLGTYSTGLSQLGPILPFSHKLTPVRLGLCSSPTYTYPRGKVSLWNFLTSFLVSKIFSGLLWVRRVLLNCKSHFLNCKQ